MPIRHDPTGFPATTDTQPDVQLPSAAKSKSSLRQWLWAVIGVALFAYLLTRISVHDLMDVVRAADPGLLILAVIVGLAITWVRAFRYAYFFWPANRWLQLYGVFALLRMLNYVLPFRSGELVTLGMLKKYRLAPTIAETSPVWLLLRITDFVALFVLMAVAVVLDRMDAATTPVMRDSYILLAAAAIVGLAVLVFIGRRFARQLHHAPAEDAGWLGKRFHKFRHGLHRVSSVRANVITMILGLIVWIGNVGSFVLVILAFPVDISWDGAMMATCIALGVNLLPVRAPLGLGTGDAAWTGAFILYGLPADKAVALTLAVRLVQMAMIGIDGLIGFLLCSRPDPGLGEVPHAC